ncbi:MAG: MFS transporter [Proteobacteria bacterium]|nr:MFS transporter [Pseudomonadota bacterium]
MSQWRAWWTVALFCVAGVLSFTDRQILSLLVDPIRVDLRISDIQISLLQGLAFAAVYGFAGLPFGRLADTFPRRTVTVVGVLIWTVSTVACGFANSFGALFAARLCVGVGEAALAPAAMSIIADSFPPYRRGTATGLFLMGMVAGQGVALAVGGALLASVQSGLLGHIPLLSPVAPWRVVLLLLGPPGILIALLLLTVREPRRSNAGSQRADGTLSLRDALRTLVQRRVIVLPLLGAMALMSAGDFALLNWIPTVLSRIFNVGPAAIAAFYGGAVIATGLIGSLAGGFVSDRLARSGGLAARAKVAAVGAMLALPGALIWAAPSPGWIVAAFCVWNTLSSATATVGITAMQEAVPSAVRGVSIASISFGNMLVGLGLGTLATALLTDAVFEDPLAVGKSVTLVAVGAGSLGIVFYRLAAARMELEK